MVRSHAALTLTQLVLLSLMVAFVGFIRGVILALSRVATIAYLLVSVPLHWLWCKVLDLLRCDVGSLMCGSTEEKTYVTRRLCHKRRPGVPLEMISPARQRHIRAAYAVARGVKCEWLRFDTRSTGWLPLHKAKRVVGRLLEFPPYLHDFDPCHRPCNTLLLRHLMRCWDLWGDGQPQDERLQPAWRTLTTALTRASREHPEQKVCFVDLGGIYRDFVFSKPHRALQHERGAPRRGGADLGKGDVDNLQQPLMGAS